MKRTIEENTSNVTKSKKVKYDTTNESKEGTKFNSGVEKVLKNIVQECKLEKDEDFTNKISFDPVSNISVKFCHLCIPKKKIEYELLVKLYIMT